MPHLLPKSWASPLDDFLRKRLGWMPARIALAVISWFGFVNLYMVRINLSIAIVAMVKRNTSSSDGRAACFGYQQNGSEIFFNTSEGLGSPYLPEMDEAFDNPTLQENPDEEGEMLWDETTQALVLGSFFYGYCLTQIIGGRVAELYGTKMVYGICILAGGISAVLSPMVARYHYGALIALRMLQGMFQGVSWPSMHACIAHWIPPIERPRFIAVVYFASTLSSAMTLPLCGVIIDNHGWPAAFYITGVLSMTWCIVWFAFMYNSPSEHPRISKKELNFIEEAVKKSGTSKSMKDSRVPWKEILTSRPVWATLIAAIGNAWGISIFFTQLPTYMKNILGFSIKANASLSALPFLARYIGGIIWSCLATWLLQRNYFTVGATRRIFSAIAMWGPGLMLIGVIYAGCNWKLIVILFCAALFCNGAATASIVVNHTDISPNFSGTIFGCFNTFGSIVAFIAPVVNGAIIDGQQTLESWQKVFWICVPLYITTEIFFLIFCSGEVQSWNNIDQDQVSSTQHYKPAERQGLLDNEIMPS